MAVAFINFDKAYEELVAASVAMGDDFDVSQCYPFYLLDFEEIAPAVKQWTAVHSRKLLNELPDKVINPACLVCPHYSKQAVMDGNCSVTNRDCINYPYIQFSRQTVTPYMEMVGYDVATLDDAELELMYMKEVEKHI